MPVMHGSGSLLMIREDAIVRGEEAPLPDTEQEAARRTRQNSERPHASLRFRSRRREARLATLCERRHCARVSELRLGVHQRAGLPRVEVADCEHDVRVDVGAETPRAVANAGVGHSPRIIHVAQPRGRFVRALVEPSIEQLVGAQRLQRTDDVEELAPASRETRSKVLKGRPAPAAVQHSCPDSLGAGGTRPFTAEPAGHPRNSMNRQMTDDDNE